jgi:hypothetical protein
MAFDEKILTCNGKNKCPKRTQKNPKGLSPQVSFFEYIIGV